MGRGTYQILLTNHSSNQSNFEGTGVVHESLATTGRYLAALRADENPHADALAALFGLDE